jgi:hypothetical protein
VVLFLEEFLLKDFRPYLSYVRNQEYNKRWYKENRIGVLRAKRDYHRDNRIKINKAQVCRNEQIRGIITLALGGECAMCGAKDPKLLTIDHIHNDGNVDRRRNGRSGGHAFTLYVYQLIKKGISPQDLKKNYQLLCWNHNCTKTHRFYFDLPERELTYHQKRDICLWKEAYDFFGPCKTCGETDLRYLTVSHIHDNGAEKRRDGEKTGAGLLSKFRVQGWPESIKEDYCLECFNCNCSRGTKKK